MRGGGTHVVEKDHTQRESTAVVKVVRVAISTVAQVLGMLQSDAFGSIEEDGERVRPQSLDVGVLDRIGRPGRSLQLATPSLIEQGHVEVTLVAHVPIHAQLDGVVARVGGDVLALKGLLRERHRRARVPGDGAGGDEGTEEGSGETGGTSRVGGGGRPRLAMEEQQQREACEGNVERSTGGGGRGRHTGDESVRTVPGERCSVLNCDDVNYGSNSRSEQFVALLRQRNRSMPASGWHHELRSPVGAFAADASASFR